MTKGYENYTATIAGIVPTIMHNGRTSNPLDPMAKYLKSITGKRSKTDGDYALLAKMEWFSGLYLDAAVDTSLAGGVFTISGDAKPRYPAENIEAMILAAAKKQRLGQLVQTGVLCDEVFPLQFKGDKLSVSELWESGEFTDSRKVKIQKNSVIRCRPIFRDWSLKISLNYLPDIINEAQVQDILVIAGRLIGLSDYRPKYGRFEVL